MNICMYEWMINCNVSNNNDDDEGWKVLIK